MASSASGDIKAPPSFSSFPDLARPPIFDSFLIASTSKSRATELSHEEDGVDDKKQRRRDKRSFRDQKGRKIKKQERSPEERSTGSSDEHDNSDAKDRHRRRHRRAAPSDVKAHGSSNKRARSKERGKLYDVPDLVSGYVSYANGDDNQTGGTFQADSIQTIYTIERNGDQEVRRYGKPYKGSVPTYRRTGYGHIVGLEGDFKITKESAYTGGGLSVIAGRNFTKAPRLGDGRIHSLITDRHFKRITIALQRKDQAGDAIPHTDFPVDQNFVPLLPESLKIAKPNYEDSQDYRSIDRPGNTSDHGDNAGSEDEMLAEEEGGESFDEYLKRRNIEFELHLRDNPRDTKTWLDLVAFQDNVHGLLSADSTKARKRAISRSETRSLCDIKISILERALSQMGNTDSTVLQLAMMKYGSEIWDTSELMKRWQALLKAKPEELKLWMEYVTFRQTHATVFSVQEVVDAYADCIARLGKAIRKAASGTHAEQSLEDNRIYLLSRVCLLLRQAGYPERALAVFQAMMELNFFAPDKYKDQLSDSGLIDALDELETFWDLEACRFGEDGATGWKHAMTSSSTELPLPMPVPIKTSPAIEDPYSRWAQHETHTAQNRLRPTRTIHESEEDDDPYSTIFFSDLRPLLFQVRNQDSRQQLLYSFLSFLGLPLNPPDASTTTPFASDTFLHSGDFLSPSRRNAMWKTQTPENFLRTLIPFETLGGEAMEPVRLAGIKDPFQPPFRKFPLSPDLLFQATPHWFCLLDQKDYLKDLDLAMVRNVMAQIRIVSKDIFLTLAHFSIEASINPKSAVKHAKRILREDSKNLLLWDAYARIEKSIGNIAVARSVYVNALQLSQGASEKERIDIPLLWRAWAEMEWEIGQSGTALAVLLAAASTSLEKSDFDALAEDAVELMPPPARILKARQFYTRQLELANSDQPPKSLFRHRISITFSLALLLYLTAGLDAASAAFDKQIIKLRQESTGSAEEEEATALHAKIIFRHTQTRTAFRPGQMRVILEEALQHYPNNSIFLSLHLFNEIRTRIDGRVRRILDEIVLKDDTVTAEGWLFAIYAEMHFNARNFNAQAVTTLFERAVENPRTKSSVSIWALFIDFELQQGHHKRAKGLLQRALVECPWAKALYMTAFSAPFRKAFRSAELNEVHRLMIEKGIRIHKRLEGYTTGWKSEESEEEDNEEMETEDAQHTQRLAAERLRLMPM